MICKGWEKAGLLRSFEKTFQVLAIKENITTLLFPTIQDPKKSIKEEEFVSEDYASIPNDSIEIIMEQSLNKVAILCACPTKTTSIINVQAQARRGLQPSPASKKR
jgi:hypothetical protein